MISWYYEIITFCLLIRVISECQVINLTMNESGFVFFIGSLNSVSVFFVSTSHKKFQNVPYAQTKLSLIKRQKSVCLILIVINLFMCAIVAVNAYILPFPGQFFLMHASSCDWIVFIWTNSFSSQLNNCVMTSFYYNYLNPSVCCFLVQIRAIVF